MTQTQRILYDYMDESSIDVDLKCSICKEPLQQPLSTICDHTFCQDCIEEWINNQHYSCPTCRKFLSTNQLRPTTRIVLHILDRLLVKCSACGQEAIQRATFTDHTTKMCPKRIVSCLASDIKCPWTGSYDCLQDHVNVCSYEQIRSVLVELIERNRQLDAEATSLLERNEQYQDQIVGLEVSNACLQEVIDKCDQQLSEKDDQIKELDAIAIANQQCTRVSIPQLKEAHG